MKIGWLVNNQLTAIPGSRTMLHDLLDSIPFLEPRCGPFRYLAEDVEADSQLNEPPDYIIRNASYFGKINLPDVRMIGWLHDPIRTQQQIEVCESLDVVVCCSEAIRDDLFKHTTKIQRIEVIPVGVDFNIFKPIPAGLREWIVFVGADSNIKGFDLLMDLIRGTPHKYLLILKGELGSMRAEEFPGRVEVHTRLTPTHIAEEMGRASLMVCTSRIETQHVAGIEGGACGVPMVATDVGIYKGRPDGAWGLRATRENFKQRVEEALGRLNEFNPRQYWLDEKLDKETCMRRWSELVNE